MGKLARFLNRQPYNSTIQDRQVLCRAECVAALKEEKRLAAATIIPIGFMYGCIFIQIYHETSIIVGKCTTHGSYVTITIAIVSTIVLIPLIPLLLHITKLLVLLIVLVPSSHAIITISSLVIHSILISNTKGTRHVWSAQLQLHCMSQWFFRATYNLPHLCRLVVPGGILLVLATSFRFWEEFHNRILWYDDFMSIDWWFSGWWFGIPRLHL